MSQQYLSGLAVVSIENDICKNLPNDEIIDQYASTKARKVPFC